MVKESEGDEYQIRFLMSTLDKSCIVSGCAGSGKSVLALLKAQRIQKERGDSYEVIVFTKALCKYMESGRKELGLKKPFNYHWTWKNRLGCPSADYVIVDEIQDFDEDEIREFINATRKCFFFFGDTAQSIYDGLKKTVAVEDIGYLLPKGEKPTPFPLYKNYRLPISIARFVQYVGIDLPPFEESIYMNRGNELPRVLNYPTVEEQIEAIQRIMRHSHLSDVGILLPHGEMVKDVGRMLRQAGVNVEERYNDKEDWRNSVDNLNFASTNPKVMTYHSAKGLQFETVFLPCMESYGDVVEKTYRKSLYVAMTRTYKNLYIMYSKTLPAPLSAISQSLYSKEEEDEFEII